MAKSQTEQTDQEAQEAAEAVAARLAAAGQTGENAGAGSQSEVPSPAAQSQVIAEEDPNAGQSPAPQVIERVIIREVPAAPVAASASMPEPSAGPGTIVNQRTGTVTDVPSARMAEAAKEAQGE